jgi:hypothetical protein
MPSGAYRHAATARAASSPLSTIGTITPAAPRSSAWPIGNGSLRATRTSPADPAPEIAWSIVIWVTGSSAPCCWSATT